MKKCLVDSCPTQTKRKYYCDKHYKRWRRHGDPMKTLINSEGVIVTCSVSNCDLLAAKNLKTEPLCHKHHGRLKRLGVTADEYVRQYGGSAYLKDGYVMVRRNGRDIGEHRAVMGEYLGRPVTKKERVHHINGVKTDNRIENLELWTHNHPSGQRVTDLIDWARELLNTYESEEALLR